MEPLKRGLNGKEFLFNHYNHPYIYYFICQLSYCAWASIIFFSQVNYILESRASTSRADYFAQKQRKLSRRTSFSFQKDKKSGQ